MHVTTVKHKAKGPKNQATYRHHLVFGWKASKRRANVTEGSSLAISRPAVATCKIVSG